MSLEEENYSMTPPMSPIIGNDMDDMEIEDEPPEQDTRPSFSDLKNAAGTCFMCSGTSCTSTRWKENSALHQALDRLLERKEVHVDEFSNITVDLFGRQFVTQVALQDDMEVLFCLLRQHINYVESSDILMNASDERLEEYLRIRKDIVHFFLYIRVYVQKYLDNRVRGQVVGQLMQQFHQLLVFLVPLHQLPAHIVMATTARPLQDSSQNHQVFHMYLDIHWSLFQTMHLLQVLEPGHFVGQWVMTKEEDSGLVSTDTDVFHQLVMVFLTGLVTIATDKHNKLTVNDWWNVSPFVCGCVHQICALLIKLLNYRQHKISKQSFWVCVNPILQCVLRKEAVGSNESEEMEIDSMHLELQTSYRCDDTLGFAFWFIMHVAKLFSPASATKGQSHSNYYILQHLVKCMFTQNSPELKIRSYLRCCLSISQLWESNVAFVGMLWDHYYKRLNEQFLASSVSINELASVSSATKLLEQCQRKTSPNSLHKDNSYELFLSILATQLHNCQGPASTEWKQIKGRIYSKFHASRMQALTEVGLHHVTSLFVTLACLRDLEDVSGKLCDLYQTLDGEHLDVGRRLAVWRGMFTLALLYVDKHIDTSPITTKLAGYFASVVSDLNKRDNMDSANRHRLWRLVSLYLEGTQDVFDSGMDLTLNQHKLIGNGWKELLRTCRENEQHKMISTLQEILSRHRTAYKQAPAQLGQTHYRDLSDALWLQFYEFVQTQSCNMNGLWKDLADVATGFALLAIDIPPSIHTGMKMDFASCVQYFAFSDQVSSKISCRFLVNLMARVDAMQNLRQMTDDPEATLVCAWFRCCWQLPSSFDQLQELTRLVLRVESVREILAAGGMSQEDSPHDVVRHFIQALGEGYKNLPDLQSRLQYQTRLKKLLGEVPRYFAPIMKSMDSPELLKNTYRIGGFLVKYCATCLYIRSRPDCLLPILIDKLALPWILIHSNKPVPALLLTVLREHTHLFIQGLGELDYRRDPYVQRKLKDLVLNSLLKLPAKEAGFSNYCRPLLLAFHESCVQDAQQSAVGLRKHILSILVSEFLLLRGVTASPDAQKVLTLIVELHNKTLDTSIVAGDSEVLLSAMFDLQLNCENASIRQLAASITQALFENYSLSPIEDTLRTCLLKTLEAFVKNKLKIFQGRALKVIEGVAALCSNLIIPLIKVITTEVKASEMKRGVGVDRHLRFAYCNILQHLGEAGQEEKSLMLMESS